MRLILAGALIHDVVLKPFTLSEIKATVNGALTVGKKAAS
jgi:hypothetical protein